VQLKVENQLDNNVNITKVNIVLNLVNPAN